jgi:hypothetical protein
VRLALVEQQVAVDLVRDDDRVARRLGERAQLAGGEDRPARVLRVAQEEGARLGAQGAAHAVEVVDPAAAIDHERQVAVRPRRELERALEVLVDRRRHESVLARPEKRSRGKM